MKKEEDVLSEVINELQPSANTTGEIDWDICIEAMKRFANQSNNIDWKKLEYEFYEQCTDKTFSSCNGTPEFILKPYLAFAWLKRKIEDNLKS